jgi:hypothetical protein
MRIALDTGRNLKAGGEKAQGETPAAGEEVKDPGPPALLQPSQLAGDGFLALHGTARCQLGRYCASTDAAEIEERIGLVQEQPSDRTDRAGEEELFRAKARDRGAVKLDLDALERDFGLAPPRRQGRGLAALPARLLGR